jgi:biotin operon repressor|tara:strand:- start:5976 stop:6410 length:435 start_codon:yes stop_codon:yes gene_type:complete
MSDDFKTAFPYLHDQLTDTGEADEFVVEELKAPVLSRDARHVLVTLDTYSRVTVPLTRQRLVYLTGISDRKVRSCIEELRGLGYPVWSDPQIAGYRMAKDATEVHALADRFERTAIRHFTTANRLRRRHGETTPINDPLQKSLF